MIIKIQLTVDVDKDTWNEAYGPNDASVAGVRADVKEWVKNVVDSEANNGGNSLLVLDVR